MDNASTLGILQRLERGEISAAEADMWLITPHPGERIVAPPFDQMQIPAWLQGIWIAVLLVGTSIVLFGAWIIASTVHTNISWLGFGVPLVLLGSLLSAVGAGGFSGHWIYVNVEPSRKRHHPIRFALPFPIGVFRLGLWSVRFIQPRARARLRVGTAHSKFDAFWNDPAEYVNALERELAEGRGIKIDMDDDAARVQVYIV